MWLYEMRRSTLSDVHVVGELLADLSDSKSQAAAEVGKERRLCTCLCRNVVLVLALEDCELFSHVWRCEMDWRGGDELSVRKVFTH